MGPRNSSAAWVYWLRAFRLARKVSKQPPIPIDHTLTSRCSSKKFVIFFVLELATGMSSIIVVLSDVNTTADSVVVILTVVRSYQLRRSAAIWQSQMWQVLVKDGTIPFCL